jgi:hypothetical protein
MCRKNDVMVQACSICCGEGNSCKVLVEVPEVQVPFGWPLRIWENNIKEGLIELDREFEHNLFGSKQETVATSFGYNTESLAFTGGRGIYLLYVY